MPAPDINGRPAQCDAIRHLVSFQKEDNSHRLGQAGADLGHIVCSVAAAVIAVYSSSSKHQAHCLQVSLKALQRGQATISYTPRVQGMIQML